MASTENIDEEVIALPEDTMNILQQFLKEKEARERLEAEGSPDGVIEENWQLSQFWYNQDTKNTLADVCRQIVEDNKETASIGLLSCPSLYDSVKKIHDNVKIFEFDQRFAKHGTDFVHFDYNGASDPNYLDNFREYFDVIIIDPPFLAEECIQKMSIIVNKLKKLDSKVILCSGEVVAGWADNYMNLKQCAFSPQHERNLGNKFTSYANFKLDEFIRSYK